MQRRAVAAYAAFFLLVGAVSFSLVATADAPEISFEDPEFELRENDSFEAGGETYTVAEINREEEVGELGETTVRYSGTLQWTVEDAPQEATWANGSVVDFRGAEYEVVIAGEEPETFTLREVIDRQAILGADPQADNETVTSGGEEFVVVREGGDRELVPVDEYFPEPDEAAFGVDDSFEFRNTTATVTGLTAQGATVEWTEDETRTRGVSQAVERTFGGTTYLAYFQEHGGGDITLILTTDIEGFHEQSDRIEWYDDRVRGLWGVAVLSWVMTVLMVGLAFLPSRY